MKKRISYEKKQDKDWGYLFLGIFFLLLGFLVQKAAISGFGPVLETMVTEIQNGAPVGKTITVGLESLSHVFS